MVPWDCSQPCDLGVKGTFETYGSLMERRPCCSTGAGCGLCLPRCAASLLGVEGAKAAGIACILLPVLQCLAFLID